MIEISVLKLAGRKAKVAFYYRLPAALQGFPTGRPSPNSNLDAETEKLLKVGEIVEYVVNVRLRDLDSQKVKEQLNETHKVYKDVAVNTVRSRANYTRKNSQWEK